MVDNMEDNIEETQINVNEGARYLQKASAYKVAAYPIAGAVLGTCLGGPIGLIAGLKIGGLAAMSCGILGKLCEFILKLNNCMNNYIKDDRIKNKNSE